MMEGAWLLYISFQNYNRATGKFVYKPSIFDEKQLYLKQEQKPQKVPYTVGLQ